MPIYRTDPWNLSFLPKPDRIAYAADMGDSTYEAVSGAAIAVGNDRLGATPRGRRVECHHQRHARVRGGCRPIGGHGLSLHPRQRRVRCHACGRRSAVGEAREHG